MRIPKLNKVKYYPTFTEMIDSLFSNKGDAPVISWFNRKGEEQTVSAEKLYSDVIGLKESLISQGLSGRHIAILSENSYEWLLVYFAATYCGAVVVCIDIEQSNDTIEQMLEMAEVDALFCSSSLNSLCKSWAEAAGDKKAFSMSGTGEGTVESLINQGHELIESGNGCKEKPAVSGESVASIVFTSGTTSSSKLVMLSHEAILTNASDALANVAIGKVAFTSLPFYHTYGLTCSVLSMLIGGAQLYINGNLRTVMRDLKLAKPHTMLTVPLMLEAIHRGLWQTAEEKGKANGLRKLLGIRGFLMKLGVKKCGKTLDNIRKNCFGEIRLIICGGAHMSADIMGEFLKLGVTVVQGYGITECAPLVSVNRNYANKLGSVGLVTPNCEVKIVDDEILVRGKNLMSGYYKDPQMTDEAMQDGWFKTGDLGYIDRDGFLYLTGRKKNLIVFKNGKKLSPEKLEEKIKKIPFVKDVVVYGAASGVSNDDVQVATSIFPNEEKTAGMDSYELLEALQSEINLINKELPLYQQIQMVNIRETEFAKTSLQKVRRHLI